MENNRIPHSTQGRRLRAAITGTLRDLRDGDECGLGLLFHLRGEHARRLDLRVVRRSAEGFFGALLQSMR